MKLKRQDKSRELLSMAFFYAMGSYMEQEVKKSDSWRELTLMNLFLHLKHEVSEIQRSIAKNDMTHIIHNCTDALSLATMLLARAMELNEMFEKNKLT